MILSLRIAESYAAISVLSFSAKPGIPVNLEKWYNHIRGSKAASRKKEVNRTIVLSVGDTHHLRLGKDRIVYAGMTSEKIFSIVQMKWEIFYRGYAWNLFFPKEQSTIRIDGVNIMVESVTPTQITLRA